MSDMVKHCFSIGQSLPTEGLDPENQAMLSDQRAEREAIAKKVTHVLEKTGISVVDLAREIGVTKQAISGWKRTGRASKANLLKLAIATGYPLEWWLDPGAPIEGYEPPILVTGGDTFALQAAREIASRNWPADAQKLLMGAIQSQPLKPGADKPEEPRKPAHGRDTANNAT